MSLPQDPDQGRRPRQINAVLGLYDKPPHRDWLVWWTVGWIVLAGVAIAFPVEGSAPTSSIPRWLNILLAALVFGLLFGVLPAYVRLLVRRARYRRAARSALGGPAAVPPAPQPTRPSDPPASAPAPRQPRSAPPPRAPADPVPIDALDMSAVRTSEVLSRSRSGMPYPVARAVRAIQSATNARDVYDGVLRASEALIVVLGVVSTTWAREYAVRTPQLDDLGRAILGGGVSQGQWVQALASVERPMLEHPHALAGMTGALKRGKAGSGLIADLTELVQERNRWAHGSAPRNDLEASERLRVVLPVLERALDRAQFLTESPWMLTIDSRYRRREGNFEVHASRATGDHRTSSTRASSVRSRSPTTSSTSARRTTSWT